MSKSGPVLVLHGSFGHPYEAWFPWLHTAVSESGRPCYVPALPTPQYQTYDNWSRIIESYVALDALADGVIVTHSSAGMFAVRFIAEHSLQISQLVTVAGFDGFLSGDDSFDAINRELFTRGDDDYSVVRQLVPQRTCFWAIDDPYLPVEELRAFSARLDARGIEVKGAGHFNASAGCLELPQVLDLIR